MNKTADTPFAGIAKASEEEHEAGKEESPAHVRWKKRLTALSDEEQRKISKKYYGGSMPWK